MRTDGFIKIGVTSSSIEKRVMAVQTGTPTPIYLVSYFIINERSKAFTIEKAIHEKLANRRTFGEWFKNIRDGSKELREILSEYGISYDDKIDLNIRDNQKIGDELSHMNISINHAAKSKDIDRLIMLGIKISELQTVKRVRKLEKKYKETLSLLGEEECS